MNEDIIDQLKDMYKYEPAGQDLYLEVIEEIERLREALALAVGELSTHGEYAAWPPEMLMNQFLEEARRG